MDDQYTAYLMYPARILLSGRVKSLTPLEELWFRRALDFGWLDGGMPSDPQEFADMIERGCTVESATKIIGRFYTPHPKNATRVVNAQQEIERKKLKRKLKQRSEAGRISGQKRREAKDLGAEHSFNGSSADAEQLKEKKRKEKETKEKEEKDIVAVFANWQKVLNHPKAVLDKKRHNKIADRLKDSTLEELLLVPQGVLKSPHHMGVNETGTTYTGIETIYRERSQVEKFDPGRASDVPEPKYKCKVCFDEGTVLVPDPDGEFEWTKKEIPCSECRALAA
jgi:hypothetical protein